jgi:anti-sigma regulatory factor (Ser/Thr protein kinase)
VKNSWIDTAFFAHLLSGMKTNDCWFSTLNCNLGFIKVDRLLDDDLVSTDFNMRIKRAARSSGFSDDISGNFVAAIHEIYNNIYEHSENADSGYVVYSALPGIFEFVVADQGSGVLASLRTNEEYRHLNDCGKALELALTDGVSRFEKGQGRGLGFRPLLIGLANISKHIRFRSGDHSREFRRNSGGELTTRTSQKSQLAGFFCSVVCEVDL